MNETASNPRVLIVTPEVTYLPDRMGGLASFFTAKAGGLADVSAALISALFEQGADVHVAIPDYRQIFSDGLAPVLKKEFSKIRRKMPDDRIHLAEDRAFYYTNQVYSYYGEENIRISLAFQREVINNIVPRVQPDLIHCNDWMTGLIPAMARRWASPACLRFTTFTPLRQPWHTSRTGALMPPHSGRICFSSIWPIVTRKYVIPIPLIFSPAAFLPPTLSMWSARISWRKSSTVGMVSCMALCDRNWPIRWRPGVRPAF